MTNRIREVASVVRRGLARLLDPDLASRADSYRRLMGQLDEARWWLGTAQPIAASLAAYLLNAEAAYHRRYMDPPRTREALPWEPPEHVNDIGGYRSWLSTHPFGDELAEAKSDLADCQGMVAILASANKDLGQEVWSDLDRLEAERQIRELGEQVRGYRERLEIVHVTNGRGERIPFPAGAPDGISCRNETIRGLDNLVTELRSELDQTRNTIGVLECEKQTLDLRVRELSAELEEVKNKLWLAGGPALQ